MAWVIPPAAHSAEIAFCHRLEEGGTMVRRHGSTREQVQCLSQDRETIGADAEHGQHDNGSRSPSLGRCKPGEETYGVPVGGRPCAIWAIARLLRSAITAGRTRSGHRGGALAWPVESRTRSRRAAQAQA